ncbi:hypothetical protein [Marinobacter sp. P4B1]|uniref:hypothetical protein n=1 Tax=Marinobacter sp. P4B1 TaxID=1119533 RepID=UPI00130E6FC0|nr:hypothetical protein [Marinobacter sp. P4B1]
MMNDLMNKSTASVVAKLSKLDKDGLIVAKAGLNKRVFLMGIALKVLLAVLLAMLTGIGGMGFQLVTGALMMNLALSAWMIVGLLAAIVMAVICVMLTLALSKDKAALGVTEDLLDFKKNNSK